jgi:hypothetical protein
MAIGWRMRWLLLAMSRYTQRLAASAPRSRLRLDNNEERHLMLTYYVLEARPYQSRAAFDSNGRELERIHLGLPRMSNVSLTTS